VEEEPEIIELKITQEHLTSFKRLDAFLANQVTEFSRSFIKKLFLDGHISAQNDNIKIELKKMPPVGTVVLFEIPPAKPTHNIPQDIPLEKIYEDDYLVIVNKQAGLVVHPAPGNPDGTLVNAVLFHCPNLAGVGNEKRPGIVHRLDKGTSGIMVIAKTQKCHEGLVNLFSTHDIERRYEAVILGAKMEPTATLESTIGRSPNNRLKMAINVKNGKSALTHFKVLKYYNRFSHVELKLETGRTHQIRVHLSQILNTPIVNDSAYGRIKEEHNMFNQQMKQLLKDYDYPLLHAKVLGFVHPITGEKLYFESKPPEIFQKVLDALEKEIEVN